MSRAHHTDDPPDVFGYLDHRAYLADYFDCKRRSGLTYRGFSRRVGLGAPNYLKQIVDGRRRLSGAMAERFAKACGLTDDAADYFCCLVAFNLADGLEQRNRCFESLATFRRYRSAQRLELAHAAYHSHAYLPAIRELVISPHFREDPAWIALTMRPPIKPVEAKRAIATLLELGLLVRDARGRLRQTNSVVTTGAQTQGLHIANYHAEMMQRAAESMGTVVAAERDITSLTMCIGPDALPVIRERLSALRKELIGLAETSRVRDRVYQLNLQLFPLSHSTRPAREEGH